MGLLLKSQCPRKSKSGKLQKIDFLLTKPIEAYQCAKYGGNLIFEVFQILIFWDIDS